MTSPSAPTDAGQAADLVQSRSALHLTIGKTFTFEASHRLHGLPDGHKCARPHGHSYQVTVEVAAEELTGPGFVTDFGDLSPFGTYLDEHFDHRDLNDVLDVEPTSELLALHLAGWFLDNVQPLIAGRLIAVTVSETRKTWARCTIRDAR